VNEGFPAASALPVVLELFSVELVPLQDVVIPDLRTVATRDG